MATLTVNGWILHLIFTPCSSVRLLPVRPYLHLTLCFHPCLPRPSYIWPFYSSHGLCSCCLLTTWKRVPLLDLMLAMCRMKWPTIYTQYFALGMQLLSEPQSLFPFYLECGYAQKKTPNLQSSDHHTRGSARPHLN